MFSMLKTISYWMDNIKTQFLIRPAKFYSCFLHVIDCLGYNTTLVFFDTVV